MTEEEIEIVTKRVDAIAEPATVLALMLLMVNRDPRRTDGSAKAWGRRGNGNLCLPWIGFERATRASWNCS